MVRFLAFALLFVITVIVAMAFVVPKFFLSSAYASERSTVIAASPAEIHAVVSDLDDLEGVDDLERRDRPDRGVHLPRRAGAGGPVHDLGR